MHEKFQNQFPYFKRYTPLDRKIKLSSISFRLFGQCIHSVGTTCYFGEMLVITIIKFLQYPQVAQCYTPVFTSFT